MEPKHTKRHTLRADETDLCGRWRLASVFTAMQELAVEHADALGVGRAALLENNLVWILMRMGVRMERYPGYGETLTLSTWPRNPSGTTYERLFLFEDEHGERLGAASSLWIIMNTETRRIVRPPLTGVSFPDTSEFVSPVPPPGRIATDAPAQRVISRVVRYSDIDINGHVNNARYVEWVCDMLGDRFFAENPPRGFDINYVGEARAGEDIRMELAQNGDAYTVVAKHANTGMTAIEALVLRETCKTDHNDESEKHH